LQKQEANRPMHRFFISSANINRDQAIISGRDVHYIKDVLRMRSGDQIELFDEKQNCYITEIISIEKETIVSKILKTFKSDTEPKTRVFLAQAIPKGKKMGLIIQKATEIGIHAIIPLITERCDVKLDPSKRKNKTTRWQKIAEEAAQQCGRTHIPKIYDPQGFADFLSLSNNFKTKILLWEGEKSRSLKDFLGTQKRFEHILVFIGPEGGLTREEVNSCLKENFVSVSLGNRILRTETAAIFVSSVIIYESDGQ
jgi:16S rRNA (uracil1498-N3)-methyltransferase